MVNRNYLKQVAIIALGGGLILFYGFPFTNISNKAVEGVLYALSRLQMFLRLVSSADVSVYSMLCNNK